MSPSIHITPPPGIDLRPVVDEDVPFLARLYASTRTDEMAMVPWTEEQKAAFLASQFEFQQRHYREYYSNCARLIVGKPTDAGVQAVGRLYVDCWPDQIRIVDISLLPEHRGAGIGGALLGEVLAEGTARGLPVTIHVELHNPAIRLYERLGFTRVESNGIYILMRRD
jgi:ribosomal protein S18 acetylase RimI-like enzyme